MAPGFAADPRFTPGPDGNYECFLCGRSVDPISVLFYGPKLASHLERTGSAAACLCIRDLLSTGRGCQRVHRQYVQAIKEVNGLSLPRELFRGAA